VTSGGSTTSAPYTKKKGVPPVARLGDVRLPHSVHGSSSTHFLPCVLKPSKVRVLRPLRIFALVLAVLKPKRIICKRTDANCSSFHLRVFLELSNSQGQRQTSTIYIPRDNFGERKAKFNIETSRTTQMQSYKCIHVP
jgi:hypothetical protein